MPFDSANVRVKRELGGSLNARQYQIMLTYMKTGTLPSLVTLLEANMVDNHNIQGRGRGRFRAWASRMYLRQSDGQIILKATGKIVIPRNEWEPTIMKVHTGSGSYGHLGIRATYSKIQKSYSTGKRNFGMSKDLVRNVVKCCTTGSCFLKNISDHLDDSGDEYSLKILLEDVIDTEHKMQDSQSSPTLTTSTGPVDVPTASILTSETTLNDQQETHVTPFVASKKEDDESCFWTSNSPPVLSTNVSSSEETFGRLQNSLTKTLTAEKILSSYTTIPVLMEASSDVQGMPKIEKIVPEIRVKPTFKLVSKQGSNIPNLVRTSGPYSSPVVMPSINSSVIVHVTPFTQTPPLVSYPHVRQKFKVNNLDFLSGRVGSTVVTNTGNSEDITDSANNTRKPNKLTIRVYPMQSEMVGKQIQNLASTNQLVSTFETGPAVNQVISTGQVDPDDINPIICSVTSIDQSEWEATSPCSTNTQSLKRTPETETPLKDKLKRKLQQQTPKSECAKSTVKEMLKKQRLESNKARKKIFEPSLKSSTDKLSPKLNSIGYLKREQKSKMKDLLLKSLDNLKKKNVVKKSKDVNESETIKDECVKISVRDQINTATEKTMDIDKSEISNKSKNIPDSSAIESNYLGGKGIKQSSENKNLATRGAQSNNVGNKINIPSSRMTTPFWAQTPTGKFQDITFVTPSETSCVSQVSYPVLKTLPSVGQVVQSSNNSSSSPAPAGPSNLQTINPAMMEFRPIASQPMVSASQTAVLDSSVCPPVTQNTDNQFISQLSPVTTGTNEMISPLVTDSTKTTQGVPVHVTLPFIYKKYQITSTTTTPVKCASNTSTIRPHVLLRTTPVKRHLGITAYPNTPPHLHIWHHLEDVRKEKHCYKRLLKVVHDMKIDIMRSVMKDKPAAERLRKKIAYGELLVEQYRSFLNWIENN